MSSSEKKYWKTSISSPSSTTLLFRNDIRPKNEAGGEPEEEDAEAVRRHRDRVAFAKDTPPTETLAKNEISPPTVKASLALGRSGVSDDGRVNLTVKNEKEHFKSIVKINGRYDKVFSTRPLPPTDVITYPSGKKTLPNRSCHSRSASIMQQVCKI